MHIDHLLAARAYLLAQVFFISSCSSSYFAPILAGDRNKHTVMSSFKKRYPGMPSIIYLNMVSSNFQIVFSVSKNLFNNLFNDVLTSSY